MVGNGASMRLSLPLAFVYTVRISVRPNGPTQGVGLEESPMNEDLAARSSTKIQLAFAGRRKVSSKWQCRQHLTTATANPEIIPFAPGPIKRSLRHIDKERSGYNLRISIFRKHN